VFYGTAYRDKKVVGVSLSFFVRRFMESRQNVHGREPVVANGQYRSGTDNSVFLTSLIS
jgi:hypothetical protein